MLIDTHAHVNFNAYKLDADEVIRRSLDGDTWIINTGSQYSTSKKAVELAQRYKEGVYAVVGLHPIHAQDGFDCEKYKQLARSPGVVAIGEIGLDYKEEYVSFKEKQKEVFLKQLDLAQELHLPIVFHCRMAHDELIEILSSPSAVNGSLSGVLHCFTANWAQAEKYLEMGLYLGFNGIIFKMSLDDIIKKTPLQRILIETDCPYLTPPPKQGRNEPIYVKYVAEKIAKIKDISFEETMRVTTENAKKLFKI
jgi:TatD DNase family protein